LVESVYADRSAEISCMENADNEEKDKEDDNRTAQVLVAAC
jgi:hypothetical protein